MNDINNKYFEWLYDLMCCNRFSKDISYRKLFTQLHNIEFVYFIRKDRNRAEDGMDLRYRFAYEYSINPKYLNGPCSVLEMMVGLAIRCEETIMDDDRLGDRTGQWFWGMITNLDLGSMYDSNYDNQYVDEVINRFIHRKYLPNGRGGLFTVRNCNEDLRKLEIWHQLCLYLDTIG